jgi:predicted GTPase
MKNYDIVIVAHEKDFNNIKYIVEYSEKNLKFDSFHLILSERKEYEDLEKLKSLSNHPIYIHKETDVLTVDKNRISHRPNWIYQMLLKMFQIIVFLQ